MPRARLDQALRRLAEVSGQSGVGILLSDSALVRLADIIDKRETDIPTEDERAAFTEGTEMTIGEACAYARGQHGRVGPREPAAPV